MSSPAAPQEKLTAWQRWEMAALAEAAPRGARGAAAGTVRLPTATEVERMHGEARAAGLAEGRAAAAEQAQRLAQLAASLTREIATQEERIAEDLVSLALAVAHQVLREALAVRRELIVPVVREAMQEMPLFSGGARLVLHPADAELVRQELGDQLTQLGWRLVEDDLVERGGCRIESAATHVDATLATRWERVTAALGRERAWLERGVARRGAELPPGEAT